jgi:hypothetical protein
MYLKDTCIIFPSPQTLQLKHKFIIFQFCKSKVQYRFHQLKIRLPKEHSFLEPLKENLFPAHLDCWQNSLPCSCGTEIPLFILSVGQGLFLVLSTIPSWIVSLNLCFQSQQQQWNASQVISLSQERFSKFKDSYDYSASINSIQSYLPIWIFITSSIIP